MRIRRLDRVTWIALALACVHSSALAQRVSPDAATGTEQERLDAAIEFDSKGTLHPGQGFISKVRLTWSGSAAYIARSVYRASTGNKLRDICHTEAARSGFFNFSVSDVSTTTATAGMLPTAVEFSVREAMAFGNGGRAWSFYIPVPRVFRRLTPLPVDATLPSSTDPSLSEESKKVMTALPPPGMLPVGELGRRTVRAEYAIPQEAFAIPPEGRQIQTDFATFNSTYSFEGRQLRMERTIVIKKLTVPLTRQSEIDAFFQSVEADRAQTFRMLRAAPAHMTTADRLNDEGTAAIDHFDFAKAVDSLNRAVAEDPKHAWAWYNLGVANLARRDARAAVEALERALAVAPSNPFVRVALGQAYDSGGRRADAEKTFKEQLELTPWSAWALSTAANHYAAERRFAEAAVMLERATSIAPQDEGSLFRLGITYLEMEHTDAAIAAFRRGLQQSRNGATFNNVAYELATRGVALDVAGQLIDEGLNRYIDAAVRPRPEDPPNSPLEITTRYASMWDTAGWILFKKGDARGALPWLEAAMWLAPNGLIGEHVGDVLAKLGRAEDAARAYARAIESHQPPATLAEKLKSTAGGRAAELRAEAATDLVAERTVALPGASAALWRGDVLLTHDRTGHVVDIRPIPGTDPPVAVQDVIRNLTLPVTFPPDDRPYRLVRRATVTCSDEPSSCSMLLWRPDDVPPLTSVGPATAAPAGASPGKPQ